MDFANEKLFGLEATQPSTHTCSKSSSLPFAPSSSHLSLTVFFTPKLLHAPFYHTVLTCPSKNYFKYSGLTSHPIFCLYLPWRSLQGKNVGLFSLLSLTSRLVFYLHLSLPKLGTGFKALANRLAQQDTGILILAGKQVCLHEKFDCSMKVGQLFYQLENNLQANYGPSLSVDCT